MVVVEGESREIVTSMAMTSSSFLSSGHARSDSISFGILLSLATATLNSILSQRERESQRGGKEVGKRGGG